MYQFLAYVPYAAVGYCAAKAAANVWPTLRSNLSTVSHYSSRHGLDGEAYRSRVSDQYCPPGGGGPVMRRNQSSAQAFMAEGVQPRYCFNEDTGQIEGAGDMDGIAPPASAVAVYEENGVSMASINVGGDNEMTIPTCAQPDGYLSPPANGGGGNPCAPRHMRMQPAPVFRQADCETRRSRIARKRNRRGWGG